MNPISAKQYEKLAEDLVTNLALDFFEDDEIDHILNEIGSYDLLMRHKLLALALTLSHASSTLVPGLLRRVKTASSFLSPRDLDQWLENAFDLRDEQGIDEALAFLSRVETTDLREFQAPGRLSLREAGPLLETYVRAVSGHEYRIIPDHDTWTDTVDIHLPGAITRFARRDENFGLYKLSAASCWAQIALGSLTPEGDPANGSDSFRPEGDIRGLFNHFPHRRLALDLYTVIESFRQEYFLAKELPGLMKQAAPIKLALYLDRPPLAGLSGQSLFIEGLWQYYLHGRIKGTPVRNLTSALSSLYGIQYETGTKASLELLFDFYRTASALSGEYVPRTPPLFIARIRPGKIAERLQEQQAIRKKKIEALITKLIAMPDLPPPERGPGTRAPERALEPAREYLLIKGRLLETDEELKSLIREKGGIPGGTLVQGSEVGGESPLRITDLADQEETATAGGGGLPYDEWDYRRGGYRRKWCSLYESDLHPGREPFVELTLKRYGGYVTQLRKKFELLRRERAIMRRQKDGGDIDLDAMVESFSDLRAGVTASENLFCRIERQERDIAVLFLVDMSGSTRGWVNQAEKESLVLMSEALEALGDRYAVYAFSSMTRTRCDLFRIKGFDEPYSDTVKRRIAGIEPKDYTRMGTFIRHAARTLASIDARTRLLITLSDSKPEDWDGYKSEYALQDTRKALIEASGRGIHPFCITIDREAQSYLPRLFGEVNYTFIDDVRKLPNRITEIYCRLTT